MSKKDPKNNITSNTNNIADRVDPPASPKAGFRRENVLPVSVINKPSASSKTLETGNPPPAWKDLEGDYEKLNSKIERNAGVKKGSVVQP